MSNYQGNIIIKNPATPTGPFENGSAPGIWTLSEAMTFKRQGIWPTQGVQGADPYFNYVSLLLSTTSLSNANNNLFVDSSGAFNPISRNGNATQGSATPYSANWSNYFDGNGDYLSVAQNAAFNLSGSTFTLEAWIYPLNYNDTRVIITKRDGGTTSYQFQLDAGTGYVGFRSSTDEFFSSSAPTLNAWNHVAATYDGTNINLYLNGNRVKQTATTINDVTSSLLVGSWPSSGYNFTGYLSNVRILKGVQAYTGATYTVPTSALTAISGTSLLTCQSNRFRDASTNNFTLTRNGDVTVTDYNPFSPGSAIAYNQSDITNWSGYFDGSGDYLQMPSNAAFAFGTGDYTIEGWIYVTVGGLDQRITWFSDDRHNIDINTSNQIFLYDGAIRTFGTVTVGTWNHFAVSRTSGTVSCYLNGVRGYNASETTNSSTRSMNIAANNAGNGYFNGYISNIRVVKGTGVYSGATITVPTTSLTAIANTSLLTLQNAAFTDNSTNNFILTPNGNVTVTGNSPFNTTGFWSNYFDGSSTFSFSSISLAADFTIEAWVYYTSTSGNPTLLGENPPNNQSLRRLSGKHYFYRQGASITGTIDIPTNQWVHLAATRSGGTVRIFTNGVLDGSGSISGAFSVFCLGGVDTGTDRLTGYASNVRIVDGTALYTATFTVPTSPLTAVSGTTLLTAQNGTFKDNSTNNRTLTRNGSPTVQTYNPFYTATIASNGGSMYFDGSGDYLAVPNSANLQFGTSNFTVECWFNSNVSTTDSHSTVIGKWGSGFNTTGDWALRSRFSNTNRAAATLRYSGGWYDITTSINVNDGAWHHLAFVRENSTTLKIYVDGVLGATRTISASDIVGSSATLSIGGPAVSTTGEGAITGYVSNARITTGTALYTAAFAPPTSVLTPSANTTLLVNGMNAGIYDATAINDLETVGNAQVSTVQSKFGGSSMYFDGSGDYLSIRSVPEFAFGTGDFTIEFWIYVTANSGDWFPISSIGNGGFFFGQRAGSGWGYGSTGNFWSYNTGTNPVLNTWQHIAISRSGTSLRIFADGTQIGTTRTDSSDWSLATGGTSIGSQGAAYYMTGYLDDLRVTKGVGRYTANFTPPTQAFSAF